MRHVADVLNFIATIVATQVVAYFVTLLVAMSLALTDESIIAYLYLGVQFLAAVLAGLHLMLHLRWQRRLPVIILLPLALGLIVALVHMARLDAAMPLGERLGIVAEARLLWFATCTGLTVGAASVWSRKTSGAVPAA